MSFNQFILPSDTVPVHSAATQSKDSWWTAYAAPTSDQAAFYQEVHRRDEEFFSRQPREIPVFTDQRFGAITPTRQTVGVE